MKSATLVLPLLFSPAQDAPPVEAPPEEIVIEVSINGAPPSILSFGRGGSKGLSVYALSTEGRPGLAGAIGGFGRTAGPDGRSGLSVFFFAYTFEDGVRFLEWQILNDAIDDPPGAVEAAWSVALAGTEVWKDARTLFDETGAGMLVGTPRFCPRMDLLAAYQRGLPTSKQVGIGLVPKTDADPIDGADPDPVRSTHQTGSPRNAYGAPLAAKYLLTLDDRYLARLMDFVAAQARRPYHLSEENGEPFFAAAYPTAHFIEGKPELREGKEDFGRMALGPAARESGGFNGWDHEHMDVEELYAAYVLCGSRMARRELILIAEELLSTPYVEEEKKHQHSARAYGWVARALLRAYQASGEPRYLEGAQRMTRSLDAHRKKEGSRKALVAMQPASDHMAEPYESPFMVAIAASALALHVEVAPDDALAKELLLFCGDLLVEQGFDPATGGFHYDYATESDARSPNPKTDGVALFIPSALCEVAAVAPAESKAKYLDPARRLYEINEVKYAAPADPQYYKWFLRAAREFE